jgi:hypothetical protein
MSKVAWTSKKPYGVGTTRAVWLGLATLDELAPGKTRFTYSVAIEPRLALSLGGPLARAHLGSMFRNACKGLQDYVLKGTLPSGGNMGQPTH